MKRNVALLLLLTFAALLIHGYHPRAEDAEIYVPGIIRILHPAYYPFGREFFETHARLTFFPNLIAWTVRLTHLSLDWALLLWHLASIYLLLFACWKIASKCFPSSAGRWAAVAMVAALLTLPISGTALYILDQYLNPRSFSAFAVLFAIDGAVEKKYLRTALWLIFTGLIHPLMVVFGISYIFLFLALKVRPADAPPAVATLLLPLGFSLRRPSTAYLEALQQHPYYFPLHWHWYEWLGIVAPLALLWWFSRIARRNHRQVMARLAVSMALFGLLYLVASLIVTIPRNLEILDRYQPMRSLFLVYLFLALFAGGLLGEWLLKNRLLYWFLLFIPLCFGMYYAQLQLFPDNLHIEWPGSAPKNPWLQAFAWIQHNTPTNAIFALDPRYMALPGEDHEGFRALAERSRLADAKTDWSAAVMFPESPLADDCLAQTQAANGWKNFGASDFSRLEKTYGVTWVVLQQPNPAVQNCPYRNSAVEVCRLN